MARVLANVASYETTVKQVVAKVRLGEADAGVVYSTDATAANSGAIRLLAIPERLNITTSLPAAVVAGAAHPEAAAAFVTFLISPAGQACLRRRGFRDAPR
jgi:molybdate transport system substrate-binding protein